MYHESEEVVKQAVVCVRGRVDPSVSKAPQGLGGSPVRQGVVAQFARRAVGAALVSVAAAVALEVGAVRPVHALQPAEGALVDIYRRVAPAVVRLGRGQALGSGFLIDRQGHVVTNNHVVQEAQTITVTFLDGTEVEARVVGTDRNSDLAVLRAERLPLGVEPLQFGDSDNLQVGQQAIAIGNPFGLSGTMTVGIVSALHRTIPASLTPFAIPDVIQTDASINPGNSGGPLLNSDGLVIGVTTAIRSSTGLFQGVGFAVPASLVRRVVPHLIAEGRYRWPWLGVSGASLTRDLARASGLPENLRGAYVDRVIPDSPAERAGVQGSQRTEEVEGERLPAGGDVIVAINAAPIRSFDDLLSYIASKTEVGQVVRLTVLRGSRQLELETTLDPRPEQLPSLEAEPEPDSNP